MIDLAGSKRAYLTNLRGERFNEEYYINLSLSALALVIKQLSEKDVILIYLRFHIVLYFVSALIVRYFLFIAMVLFVTIYFSSYKFQFKISKSYFECCKNNIYSFNLLFRVYQNIQFALNCKKLTYMYPHQLI